MVRFRQKTRVRNYLARSEQRRLLVLVMTLGLVILLTREAARPQRWFWMWGGHPPEQNERLAGDDRLVQVEIDNRIAENPAGDDPGDSVKSPAAAPDRGAHGGGRESISVNDPSVGRADWPKSTPDPFPTAPDRGDGQSAKGRYFPGVQTEYLKTIRDDTILRRTEADAFYHLLRILADHSDQELTAASAGRVTFAQLFRQSNEYRGELVTIRGTVQLAVQKTAPANDYGVGNYYELWVVPHDQRDSPLVVNCLELPAAFPRSGRLAEQAAITGFFFKRFAYQAQDGRLHTTPLLLAKTIHWSPAAPAVKAPAALSSFLWCLAAAALLASAVVMYVRRRSTSSRPSDLPDHVEWNEFERRTAERQTDAGH